MSDEDSIDRGTLSDETVQNVQWVLKQRDYPKWLSDESYIRKDFDDDMHSGYSESGCLPSHVEALIVRVKNPNIYKIEADWQELNNNYNFFEDCKTCPDGCSCGNCFRCVRSAPVQISRKPWWKLGI